MKIGRLKCQQESLSKIKMSALQTNNLSRRFGKKTVVRDVSVCVERGEVVGLLGPNGAGKTTTFNMTVGFLKPHGGNVFLGNRDITNLPMYKRARSGIGYLPQESSVFSGLTVSQNLHIVLDRLSFSKQEKHEIVQQHLKDFRLENLKDQKAASLSGGERRRTEVARALVVNPKFLLLDEPFVGIDPITAEDLQAIIRNLAKRNIGILITDHNVHETLAITDRAYLLVDGKIVREGTAEDLATDRFVKEKYLGEKFVLQR